MMLLVDKIPISPEIVIVIVIILAAIILMLLISIKVAIGKFRDGEDYDN